MCFAWLSHPEVEIGWLVLWAEADSSAEDVAATHLGLKQNALLFCVRKLCDLSSTIACWIQGWMLRTAWQKVGTARVRECPVLLGWWTGMLTLLWKQRLFFGHQQAGKCSLPYVLMLWRRIKRTSLHCNLRNWLVNYMPPSSDRHHHWKNTTMFGRRNRDMREQVHPEPAFRSTMPW